MKSNITVAVACVFALIAGFYLQIFGFNLPVRQSQVAQPEIDGLLWPNQKQISEFEMIDTEGNLFGVNELSGNWNFVFFGYTHCPDICPITMNTLRQVQGHLSDSNTETGIDYLFVSVDGARDTPEHLKSYITYFGDGFKAITGNTQQVDSLTTQIGVPYAIDEHEPGEDYLVAHSGAVFLLSPESKLTAIYQPPHDPEEMAQRFSQIIQFMENS